MIRRVRNSLHSHVGVRAEGMILAGAIWTLIGVGVITGPAVTPPPSVWHALIPAPVTAAIWVVTGVAAAAMAPSRRGSEIGLLLLTLPPGIRFTSYLYAWIAEIMPGPPPGDPRGWLSSLFYAAMLLWVAHLSRVPADVQAPLSGSRR